MPWRMIALILTSIVTAAEARCALIVIDDFEQQLAGSGAGNPVGYFSFGDQLADRGVSSLYGATSGIQSAVYDINFSNPGFGVGAVHENLNLQFSPATELSVQIKTLNSLGNIGFIGFRLEDSDGSVYRTADADLFAATTTFQKVSQLVSGLTTVDVAGGTVGLNLLEIRSVGLLFFDRGFSGTTRIIFDDLTASVPEPGNFVSLVLVCISVLSFSKGRLNHRGRSGEGEELP